MPLVLTSEQYNGLPSLYGNAGDWISCEVQFYYRFDYLSTDLARVTYNEIAGDVTLTLPSSDDWTNYGFSSGDSITLSTIWTYEDLGSGIVFPCPQGWARTITYISGNVLHINSALVAVGCSPSPPSGVFPNGATFPTDPNTNNFSPLVIVKSDAAEEIEFQFNLTPNGGTSLASVLDGQLNRFTSNAIAGMTVGSTVALSQLVKKSGGYLKDVELTLDSFDAVAFYRSYTLTYKILQWGFIQDGFSEPNYYNAADHLAPILNIQLYGQTGNPNTVLEVTSENTQADTGGFDENYNGGINQYTFISTQWQDYLGNPISGMDYSNECTFETFITAPGQSVLNSTFRIGLVFRPTDGTVYQNLPESVANNLLVNASENDFVNSLVPDPTVWPGFENSAGARLDITNVEFFISGSDLRVRGKIVPNAAAETYFSGFPDSTRKVSMWVSIGNYLTDGLETSERVNLLIYDQDIIDAPTLGVQIPDVVGTAMYDHAQNTTDTGVRFESIITTEDDVRYDAMFKLIDNVDYEGIRLRAEAYNTVTGDQFTLEEVLFSFATVPNIAGQFQPNFIIPRNFNLPPSSDRNVVTLSRMPTIDEPGKYGLQLCYGFLSRWEYWLQQLNADNDFFDITEPNDGKNKDWQHYSDTPDDWDIRFSLFTIVDGVEDFDYHTVKIRPYEDENVTTVVTYTRLSDGTNPTSLVGDELMEVEAVLTWNAGTYEPLPDTWACATIEDYEAGNRWLISSVLPHGGVAANPLQPIAGATGLDLQISGNVATLKFIVDTNKISVDKVSLTYRISSLEDRDKVTTDDEDKLTTTDETKVLAP